MSETAELAAALAAFQAELPEVKKNRTADVANKDGRKLYSYTYADLADVSAAVLPVLGRHGLAFTAFPGHGEDGKFGLRYYLLHVSGESIPGFFEIDDKGGMQLVGGRITYARRYCLCAVTGVIAEDDVDARGDGHEQPRTAQRKTRAQSSPPAQAAVTPAADTSPPEVAGGDLPPLPDEEAVPAAPAAVTPKQLTAIWTVLSEVFLFGKDERDEARKVCAHIVNRELASSTHLTKQEAATVLDTLAHWEAQAQREDERPRAYLQMMTDAAGGEPDDE
jgi:hypothetical protein